MSVMITIGAGLNDTKFGKLQAPLASFIESRAEQIEQEEKIGKLLFREVKSTHFGEHYATETEMEDMVPVGENGAYPETSVQDGYGKTIENVTFKNSFSISREAMDDNVLTSLQQKPEKLLKSYYRGRNRLMAAMIGNALQGNDSFKVKNWSFSTLCMDGGCVFSKTHAPKVKGANQSNLYATAFSADALFAGITAMRNLKDDDGNTLSLAPDTIVIPTADYQLVKKVLAAVASLQEPGGSNNDINPLFGALTVVQWPGLNDYLPSGGTNTPWILFDSKFNQENNGNIYQERVGLEVRSELGNNDENIWKAYARYSLGFVDFRQMMAFGVTGGSTL